MRDAKQLLRMVGAMVVVFISPWDAAEAQSPSSSGQSCPCSAQNCPSLKPTPPSSVCLLGNICIPPGSPSSSPVASGTSGVASSSDPNGKITVGFGDQGFIPAGASILYTIFFENKPTANAPANQVVVLDSLDSHLDWSTVQLVQIGFNNVTVAAALAVQSYSGQANVSTDPNPVSISGSLNPSTGVLTWTMQSVDPVTGTIPQDPLAGFLPPDNAGHQGEGFVTFSVQPKSGLENGTVITNQASIVFDRNAAILTNTVTNTVSSVYPTSNVDPLPATSASASFPVSWSGSDPGGSGIAFYDIYSSTDSGPYTRWLGSTTAVSATFSGSLGHTYSFYSLATDNVGYRQQTPGPVQSIKVASPGYTVAATSVSLSPGDIGHSTVTVSSTNGYTGTVALTCAVTSSPLGAVDPPTCGPGGPVALSSTTTSGSASITVNTTAPTSSALVWPKIDGSHGGPGSALPTILALLVCLLVPRRRPQVWFASLSTVISILLLSSLLGCGGGGTHGTRDPGTTKGTYTITVTAKGNDSGATKGTATFTVTVN